MNSGISEDHPRQRLLFFIDDDVRSSDVEAMANAVATIASSREWVIGVPEFVDETLEPETAVDQPIRTVGGILELFSGWPPWDTRIPRDIDHAHLCEVENTVDAMVVLSRTTGKDIAFELDGTQVGWISKGQPDSLLREGLLEPWRQKLRTSG
jgi:hypothetical protein